MRAIFILLGLILTAADSGRQRLEARASAETAAIQGRVSISGAQQKLKPLPVFKSRAFCGATVRNETLLIGADGGVENAVVLLRPLGRKTTVEPKRSLSTISSARLRPMCRSPRSAANCC
jgi:hypothetical protein